MTTDLCTPWTLDFDRDGTEDFGIIRDADGLEIAASHLPCTRIAERTFQTGTFWRPERRDPTPLTIRQLRLMTAAPMLLEAARRTVRQFELILEMDDPQALTQMEWEAEPLSSLRTAIAEAEG